MELKEKFKSIFQNKIVGGSVVFIQNNDHFEYHYGYRSLIENKPVEEDTIFRIASISKVIVGIGAVRLVEMGLLDLDEDISDIFGFKIINHQFPDIPITTRMLMLHTSSITDGPNNNGNIGYNGVNGEHYYVDLKDLLVNQHSEFYAKNTYSDFAPGQKYNYSNFGTGIIACIIEKRSKQLFTEFIENEFFKPLHMDASFKAKNIIKQEKISDAFIGFVTNKTGKAFIDSTYPDFSLGNNFRGPAGGMFVSSNDLSKIMIAMMNDGMVQNTQILNKQSVDNLLAMGVLAKRYIQDKQITLQGATGGAYGISSVMYFSKQKKTGVCFVANGGNYLPAPTGLNDVQEAVIDVLISELDEKNKIDR
jgi:CubicO group peptidase (beta-lactamase class C family)